MKQGWTQLWRLKNHDLFCQRRKSDLKMVDRHSRMREIKRGATLSLEGTPDTSFPLLKKGSSRRSPSRSDMGLTAWE